MRKILTSGWEKLHWYNLLVPIGVEFFIMWIIYSNPILGISEKILSTFIIALVSGFLYGIIYAVDGK